LRYSLVTRPTHWINALAISGSLMSGLQIFNAFTALYRGDRLADDPPGRRDLDAGRRWPLLFAWVLMINSSLI
jgi:thiosulfate reductase cytochrome b subunit